MQTLTSRDIQAETYKQRHTSRDIQADTYKQTHTSRLVEPETLRGRQAHLRLCERLQHVVPESVVGCCLGFCLGSEAAQHSHNTRWSLNLAHVNLAHAHTRASLRIRPCR